MLNLPESQTKQDVTIESKEIPLNFDSRVARGLVVTVRALDRPEDQQLPQNRVSVNVVAEARARISEEVVQEVIKSEIFSLERKRERFPNSDVLVNQLASLYALIGDSEAAVRLLRNGLKERPSPILKARLAALLVTMDEFEEAESLLDSASDDWKLPALVTRAYVRARKGDAEGTRKLVSEALELDFFDYSARLFAGAIFIWDGAYREAIRSFKIAAEERPKSSIPLVHMAAAYFALGQRQQAITALRRATQLNPLDDRAVAFYCDLLFLSGQSAEALRPLQRIFDIWGTKTREAVMDRLTKAYFDESQFGKALELIQKRLKAKPGNLFLINNAGIALAKMGRKDEAKGVFLTVSEHALTTKEEWTAELTTPAINFLTILLQANEYELAVRYGLRFLGRLSENTGLQQRVDVTLRCIEALAGCGKPHEAAALAELELTRLDRSNVLALRLIPFLLHYYSVVSPKPEKCLPLAEELLKAAERPDIEDEYRMMFANNALFTLLQFDRVSEAGRHLGLIAPFLLKNPYVTATFGLFYLLKGDVAKGRALYDKAIDLASDTRLKARIRQRMALELTTLYAARNENAEALYWANRVINEKEGFDYVTSQALRLREEILRRKLH